jgi:hypothetical protein
MGERADGIGVLGMRGLRLSPDQRPWRLPLRRMLHLPCKEINADPTDL